MVWKSWLLVWVCVVWSSWWVCLRISPRWRQRDIRGRVGSCLNYPWGGVVERRRCLEAVGGEEPLTSLDPLFLSSSTGLSTLLYTNANMPGNQIIAFDLYGTLLSTASIANQLEQHFGQQAQSIASLWRRYQMEYTWRLNSMGSYPTPYSVHPTAPHKQADLNPSPTSRGIPSAMLWAITALH